jgi:broad specificity phosphatase PhoE
VKIVFIRHSKTLIEPEKPVVLWGLSDEGIVKVKLLSEEKIIKDVEILYASLQTKAIETAIYLAKPNSIPIRTNSDFTEITSFTNKFISKEEGYQQSLDEFYHDAVDRIADGETHQEALKRYMNAIETVVSDETNNGVKTIGIVSHGHILSYFTSQYTNYSPYDLHDKIQMPDVAVFNWDSKKFESLWTGIKW